MNTSHLKFIKIPSNAHSSSPFIRKSVFSVGYVLATSPQNFGKYLRLFRIYVIVKSNLQFYIVRAL
jgi:hypothetical protein